MNAFLRYLSEHELDINEMSSDEIVEAYNSSGESSHHDLIETTNRLPLFTRLKVLLHLFEDALQRTVKGYHQSDND